MSKKKDLPYMPFYIGDWLKAPEIRMMSLITRMVWFEMLCLMWQSNERGYLTINSKPFVITDDITGDITKGEQSLARMLNVDITTLQQSFRELKELGVYSVRSDGAIYSRFMVKLVESKAVKSKAGSIGMQKRYNKNANSVITGDITHGGQSLEIENNINNKTVNKENVEYSKGDNTTVGKLTKVEGGVGDFPKVEEGQKENEKKICPQMVKKFKEKFPEYLVIKDNDHPACLKIAYNIGEEKKWSKHSIVNEKQKDVIQEWALTVDFIHSSDYFSKLSLDQIAKQWQGVRQSMRSKPKNKQKTSGVRTGMDTGIPDHSVYDEIAKNL